MAHLILTSPSWSRRLYFDLFALDLGLVEVFHRLFRIPYVVELDEFVVLLVGSLSDLFYLAILSKCCLQFVIARGRIQVEDYQRALVLILLGGVVLRYRVVDVKLAPAYDLPL